MMHSFIPPDRFFPYLTWTEIRDMPDKARVVIIQPVGAIEQHGPHLPLVVDAAIGLGVLGKALERLDSAIPAFAMPSIYYGKSNEHWHFPGTISISAETMIHLLMETGESLYRAGFRKWILMNSHGGQPQIMDIVARDLHVKFEDFEVFPFSTWRVPHIAKQLMTEKEAQSGIHAGDAETSLMMALLPDQVRGDRLVCEYPYGLPEESLLTLERSLSIPWTTRDISESGVIGDATTATREKGDRILDSLAQGWASVIRDVYQFKQPQRWKA